MSQTQRATGPRLLLLIGVVAAAYYLSGRLGLLLAIPPGYATAVWPASGIALAAVVLGGGRLAAGVALGSFFVNFTTSFDAAQPLGSTLVAAAIASGAAAQAMLGAFLIERHVGYRNVLVQELAAVRMLVLGGPVACVLNAVVGVGSLWLNGQVEAHALALNLGTWWVGDTIGVLIFTPLVLVWAVRPYRDWILHQLFVTVPLAVLFAAVVTMFVVISRHEQARLSDEFDGSTRTITRELHRDFTSTLAALDALEGLYASSERVDAAEFTTFAERLVAATPSIRGLTWNPVVEAGMRAGFEAAARAGGLPGYAIVERDASGAMVPARERPGYAPVRYAAPASTNDAALGFDAASEPVRRAALEAARDSGAPAATGRVELVQGGAGFLVYMPVFRGGTRPQTVEARRSAIAGFACAILGLERLMSETVRGARQAGLAVELVDAGPAGGEQHADTGPELWPSGALRNVFHVGFAGRDLRLVFELPAQTLLARRSWATWAVLAGGLALTSLVGVMLLLGVGREAHFEALVGERTESLRRSEEALRHEASHDHLTGLPNRLLFLDRLGQAIERGRRHGDRFGLLYLDIDGFKAVNDGQGHHAGDELLRQIAGRLRGALRAEDTVARLGGDEFAVLLAPPADAGPSLQKAGQLVAALGAPYALVAPGRDPVEVRVGASIGVAVFPGHGQTVDELVHAADEAMYQAKKGGKNSSRLAD
jgi:diguanylate cyclase (GGDEF)-like protein